MTTITALEDQLYDAIVEGQRDPTEVAVQGLLAADVPPHTILYETMIEAMGEVGARFEEGQFFVPEMLVSARAMQAGLDLLRPALVQSDMPPQATIAIGTVKSDIHDIGKNLVGMMFEGAGFHVIDLGVNVPPEKFVEAAQNGADIIGISALLTTTMVNIPAVLTALEEAGVRQRVKVIVGGAPLDYAFAQAVGADGFADNAHHAVEVGKALLGLVH